MAATLDISRPTLHVPTDAFRNEPLTDFSNSETARRMQQALSKVRAELGREYDMVIGEKLIRTTEKITSTNPAKPSEVIGIFQSAGKEHVEMAIAAATTAFESWKRTSVEQRASMIHAVAGILRERKFEFAAWMVY
ncbi:MAG TPA: aldehyde dehydrogenase family protein, partial [Candidatus Angelobacter sp.]|nr:aldehyde dehydrogenase family protein [Candidatus Angelobacter sp.]